MDVVSVPNSRSARSVLAALLAVAFVCLAASLTCAQEPSRGAGDDVVYLIDVSGSMIGLGEAPRQDILPEVVRVLRWRIENTPPGTRLIIMTFSEGLFDVDGPANRYSPVWERAISEGTAEADRAAAVSYVLGLNEAVRQPTGHGWETAIWDSVKAGFDRLDEIRTEYLRSRPGEAYPRNQRLYLLTDGRDTASRSWDLQRFLDYYRLRRGEHPNTYWTFYTQTEIVPGREPAGGAEIQGPPVPRLIVRVQPTDIDFGDLRGKRAEAAAVKMELVCEEELRIPPTRLQVREVRILDLPPGGALNVRAEPNRIETETNRFSFRLIPTLRSEQAWEDVTLRGGRGWRGTVLLEATSPNLVLSPGRLPLMFSYGPPPRVRARVDLKGRDFGNLFRGRPKEHTLKGRIAASGGAVLPPTEFKVQVLGITPARPPNVGIDVEITPSRVSSETPAAEFVLRPVVRGLSALKESVTRQGTAYRLRVRISATAQQITLENSEQELSFMVKRPPWWPWLLLLVLAAPIWFLVRPRFDREARLLIPGGEEAYLRPLQGLWRTSVTVGGRREHVNLGADRRLALLKAAWGGACVLHPVQDVATMRNGVKVDAPVAISPGDKIEVGDGRKYEFTYSRG
jgi:hypothetical protein